MLKLHGFAQSGNTFKVAFLLRALGVPFEKCQYRALHTLSGGEQKRLVLEALLRGPDDVLLLDEPDNYLDVPGKRWLEEQLRATAPRSRSPA